MSQAIVVTGTDTDIGKTVFSAALTACLGASYWKPVQAGLDGETDSEAVMRLGGLSAERIIPEAYRLHKPASPHRAAELDSVEIKPQQMEVPVVSGPLIIEGAGGLMVPLTREITFLDVFARWGLPVVLCARTALGTINHTLLSLKAMRDACVPVMGVAFIGKPEAETERVISTLGNVTRLGRLPWIEPLEQSRLMSAFHTGFGSFPLR